MMAPTLVVLVRVLWVIVRHHKQDVHWMVADLFLGKKLASFDKMIGMPEQQRWIGKRIGTWNGPEGREYCVEPQAIRQAPDYHSRL
jgi:hypothetical protein